MTDYEFCLGFGVSMFFVSMIIAPICFIGCRALAIAKSGRNCKIAHGLILAVYCGLMGNIFYWLEGSLVVAVGIGTIIWLVYLFVYLDRKKLPTGSSSASEPAEVYYPQFCKTIFGWLSGNSRKS